MLNLKEQEIKRMLIEELEKPKILEQLEVLDE